MKFQIPKHESMKDSEVVGQKEEERRYIIGVGNALEVSEIF